MLIYPAIDIKQGRVVRLFEGDHERETVYATDPLAQAERFAEDGASWLHVVDMDRAFATGDNTPLLRRIAAVPGVRVQAGGLLRTEDDLNTALDAGAARAVISTAAALDRRHLDLLVRRFGPGRLALAIDTRNGRPVRRGSTEPMALNAGQLAGAAGEAGITRFIYRDLQRDGALAGFNVAGASGLRAPGRELIISGGGSALRDLEEARAAGLDGAIVGRALYENCFTLREAIACSG